MQGRKIKVFGVYIKNFYPDIYTKDYDTLMEGFNRDVYRKLSRTFYAEKGMYKDDD